MQSLLVIEEYDKVDCATRAMLRQLFDRGQSADGYTFRRSVVILEANTGFLHLHKLLTAAGGRRRVSADASHEALKDVVAEKWAHDACESHEDRAKLLSLIDSFVAFLPLEKKHVRQLVVRELQGKAREAADRGEVSGLEWTDTVVDHLLSKVRFSLAAPPGRETTETQ